MNDLSAFEPLLDELVKGMATKLGYVNKYPNVTKSWLREAIRMAMAEGIPTHDIFRLLQELVQTYHETRST